MRNILALILTLFLLTVLSAQTTPLSQSLVLTHVTVIDMTGTPAKPDQTVVITNGHILTLGKSGELSLPQNSQIIDASGKFLIPGLWDMHAHTVYERADDTEKTLLPLFIVNGVTGIRNPGSINSLDQINRWRKAAAEGKLIAPRIVIGQQVDGVGGDTASFVYRVKGETEARAAVDRIKREGFDFVKVYSRLSRSEYFAIVDEAKRLGIPFEGHVPLAVNDGEASDAGQKSIEHLEGMQVSVSSDEVRIRKEWLGYEAKLKALNGKPAPPELEEQQFRLVAESMNTYDAEKADRLYTLFARNGTYHCPTLVIHQAWGSLLNPAFFNDPRLRYLPKRQRRVNFYTDPARSWSAERKTLVQRLYAYRLRMVGEMNRAKVKLLAGTDTSSGYPVAGFALHDELALLVQAGLSPVEALQTATINAAEFLGLKESLGTIEAGKLADLVLLDANPLADINNTRKIFAVIANGRYLPKEELQKIIRKI
ncbi:MAG TPA: amidohydrolase family protein [Pyrinomonadaceae bacterium]|nr:amidohydrolase family protein [Pyrinomonadaceae bacterium]